MKMSTITRSPEHIIHVQLVYQEILNKCQINEKFKEHVCNTNFLLKKMFIQNFMKLLSEFFNIDDKKISKKD